MQTTKDKIQEKEEEGISLFSKVDNASESAGIEEAFQRTPRVPTGDKRKEKNHKPNYRVVLKVENIVVSVEIAKKIDVNRLLEMYSDIEKKENFPGLVVKLTKPHSTLLIFKSGKIVITGVHSQNHISEIVEIIKRKLRAAGITIYDEPIVKIENIVMRGNFFRNINLDLASLMLDGTIFEPEIFPGLIYKLKEPRICFLIFNSGKIIVTGAKDEETIKRAVKYLGITLRKNDLFRDKKEEDTHNLELLDL